MKPIWPWPMIAGLREPGAGIGEQELDVARARLAAVDPVDRAQAAAERRATSISPLVVEAGQASAGPRSLSRTSATSMAGRAPCR